MPTQTIIEPQVVQGPYPSLPAGEGSLDLVFTAVDAVNGNYFFADPVSDLSQDIIGGYVLLVTNTGEGSPPGPLTITFTSQPINGRSGDITSYSVGVGVTSAFKYSQLAGWADVDNLVYFLAQAGLLVAIVTR